MKNEYVNVLSQSPVFKGLEPEEITSILERSNYQVKRFATQSMIAQSGSRCVYARIVLSGRVAGEMMDPTGKVLKIEDIEVSKMIAPAFLYGKNQHYPVNVLALEETSIWQMHREDFTSMLQKELSLLNNYLNAISNRAQFLSDKIRFLSFPTLKAKISFLLIRYMDEEGNVETHMTHQQMAELFGVTRPSLSREIRRLHEDGFIQARRNKIYISDPDALRALLLRK